MNKISKTREREKEALFGDDPIGMLEKIVHMAEQGERAFGAKDFSALGEILQEIGKTSFEAKGKLKDIMKREMTKMGSKLAGVDSRVVRKAINRVKFKKLAEMNKIKYSNVDKSIPAEVDFRFIESEEKVEAGSEKHGMIMKMKGAELNLFVQAHNDKGVKMEIDEEDNIVFKVV